MIYILKNYLREREQRINNKEKGQACEWRLHVKKKKIIVIKKKIRGLGDIWKETFVFKGNYIFLYKNNL